MSASKLKRISEDTERAINQLAENENRTFIAQLDVVVAAGMNALGHGHKPPATRKRGPKTKAATPTGPTATASTT